MHEKLHSLLNSLRLKGIASCIDDVLNTAEKNGTAISEVLIDLLETEYVTQQDRALTNRIKRAKLPWGWSLDTFPFKKQPGINKTQIMGLAKLNFLEQNENIIFIGKTGTGKSGIAMGILRLALLNGYHGRFYNAQDMLNELYASLADKTTSKMLNILSKYPILVIDELGYLNLTPEQINIFFKLIADFNIISFNMQYCLP